MPRTKQTNVINFASRVASVRQEAITRRQKELAFKLIAEGKKPTPLKSTTDALIQDGIEWRLIADSAGRSSKIWRQLYKESDRALKSANRKITKLERQLAAIKGCSA